MGRCILLCATFDIYKDITYICDISDDPVAIEAVSYGITVESASNTLSLIERLSIAKQYLYDLNKFK